MRLDLFVKIKYQSSAII